MNRHEMAFWSIPSDKLLERLQTTSRGLSNNEVWKRLEQYGSNRLRPKKKSDVLTLLFSQFKSPIILILLFAAVLSFSPLGKIFGFQPLPIWFFLIVGMIVFFLH